MVTCGLLQDHERVVDGPVKMVIIPPRHFCVIDNPCEKDATGNVVLDKHGTCKLDLWLHGNKDEYTADLITCD